MMMAQFFQAFAPRPGALPLTATPNSGIASTATVSGIDAATAQEPVLSPESLAAPLPATAMDGWKTCHSSDGRTFYHHSATKRTQWAVPQPDLSERVSTPPPD